MHHTPQMPFYLFLLMFDLILMCVKSMAALNPLHVVRMDINFCWIVCLCVFLQSHSFIEILNL